MRHYINLRASLSKSVWAIDRDYAEANMAWVVRVIKGEQIEAFPSPKAEESEIEAGYRHFTTDENGSPIRHSDHKAPNGSSAVVSFVGPLMKHDGLCSEGALSKAESIRSAADDTRANQVVLRIDGPGGEASGLEAIVDAISYAKTKKKVIACVDNGSAFSAHYWAASNCDEIYVSHNTGMVGSIGVFSTLYDFTKYLEKMGVKEIDIYAPESPEKNKDYKEAIEKGDYSLIEGRLSVIAQRFQSVVRTGRGDRLKSEDVLKGGIYFAPEAQKLGLIDGVKTFAEVLAMATNKTEQENNNQEMGIFGTKYKALNALEGVAAEDVTTEQLRAANKELSEAGINCQLTDNDTASAMRAAGKQNESLETANKALEDANAAVLTDLVATLKETGHANAESLDLAGAVAAATTSLKDWAKKPAGEPTNVNDDTNVEHQGTNPEFAHNKEADNGLY